MREQVYGKFSRLSLSVVDFCAFPTSTEKLLNHAQSLGLLQETVYRPYLEGLWGKLYWLFEIRTRISRCVCSRIFIRCVCSWIHRAISTLRLNVYRDLRRVALTSGIESVPRLRRARRKLRRRSVQESRIFDRPVKEITMAWEVFISTIKAWRKRWCNDEVRRLFSPTVSRGVRDRVVDIHELKFETFSNFVLTQINADSRESGGNFNRRHVYPRYTFHTAVVFITQSGKIDIRRKFGQNLPETCYTYDVTYKSESSFSRICAAASTKQETYVIRYQFNGQFDTAHLWM